MFRDGALSGAANMARDHALAASAKPGRGAVRFYRWAAPTLSFGRNEPVTVGYREFLKGRPDVEVVRRPTGGRAVIHDRELTYSVVVPVRAFGGPKDVYRAINGALVDGMRKLGVDAVRANGRPRRPAGGPCFLDSEEGDVVVGGRKLVGSAQARIGPGVLQHGSLLLAADQGSLLVGNGSVRDATSPPGRSARTGAGVASRPVTLTEILGEAPAWDRLVDALGSGFARVFPGTWKDGSITEEEEALARDLEVRYRSGQWTWRR